MKKLPVVQIRSEKIADFRIKKANKIDILQPDRYCVVEGYSIRGEAPKSFIKVQESCGAKLKKVSNLNKIRAVRRISKKRKKKKWKIGESAENWTLYIAKTGHKWYPVESITEHLIAKIGIVLGLDMAHSRLVTIGKQIRFLSRYFINHSSQELVHGADILAIYLEDKTFVEEVQKKRREHEFFTLDMVYDAIMSSFPKDHILILEGYFLMLIFDCWLGVQDRHFENWGVIRSIYGNEPPRFSPIYDSARGLFWNEAEKKIQSWIQYKQVDAQIEILAKKSRPQVGLKSVKVNHFELIEEILTDKYVPIRQKARLIFTDAALENVKKMVKKDFKFALSNMRIELIIKCIEARFLMIEKILH